MSITLGSNIAGVYVGNSKIVKAYLGSSLVFSAGLPAIAPYTMRFQFNDGFDPSSLLDEDHEYIGTWTHVSGSVWDFTYQNERWYAYGFSGSGNKYLYSVLSIKTKNEMGSGLYGYDDSTSSLFGQKAHVLGANLSGVRYLVKTFYNWGRLKSIAWFDTSMLYNASELVANNNANRIQDVEYIPNFNFSSITDETLTWNGSAMASSASAKKGLASFAFSSRGSALLSKLKAVPDLTIPADNSVTVDYMFGGQYNVESGALALYNKFAAANWQGSHTYTFRNCGRNTNTGAAELAQIPSSWGGTGA